MNGQLRTLLTLALVATPLAAWPLAAGAQEPDTTTADARPGPEAGDSTGADPAASAAARTKAKASGEAGASTGRPEERAERARREAGLRAGLFGARGLGEMEGVAYAATPVFEGWFQKGLDRHLALESSIGFWRRTQWREGEGGFFGEAGREEVASYVVPLLTAVKLYPLTGPESSFEPWLTGGVGFALGIDDRENPSGGLLGAGGAEGTAILTGFGFKAGGGVDLRMAAGVGLTLGARYQWTRFGQAVGGNRTYQGWALDGGLLYRFRY